MYTYVNWFSRNGVHTIMNPNKIEKMDMMRMKDIISQLTDVIYLLCDAKDTNITAFILLFLIKINKKSTEQTPLLSTNLFATGCHPIS